MNTKDELAKAYDPKPVEEKWGKFWLDEGLFVADPKSPKPKFSMVLPPPNVTGILHMGHALCFTLPDIITRWKRMQGYNCLWLPGTDHASIAVHNVIEKSLAEKGLTREKVGREEFLRIAWDWKAKYGGAITGQLKKLGASLDWSRERFTMDPGFSRAVKQVFVSLYDEGLIYRDYFLVNRCPHCRTVLSDIEIEHKDLHGKLWHIRYAVEGSAESAATMTESVIVATTRPETMLGDTALAVHPDDGRYTHLHGRRVILPLQNRSIPVITDERVERKFGTGAVKVTPAHDPVDFELGKKHGLEQVIVIDGSGRMTEAAGPDFAGLDRFACRAKVVEKLREQGLLVKVEDHDHAVGHCYRCKNVIEPHLSWQWFVRIKPLADEAIRVVEDGSIEFIPANWAKTYFEWMYNIHDWCISRQLWWGHRIPVWKCEDCGEYTAGKTAPDACRKCGGKALTQDPDVLDTWFSSALWPFATLGWPKDTPELHYFYPTSVLTTAREIIYLWVARMIMTSLHFLDEIPFREVYIYATVLNEEGRRMSKSLGTGIDPLDMIDKCGADALRFALIQQAGKGQDIRFSEKRVEDIRNFCNKIWNMSRFVLLNLDTESGKPPEAPSRDRLRDEDKWILSRLQKTVTAVNKGLEGYDMDNAARALYDFLWSEYADWYIEIAKPRLQGNERPIVQYVLWRVLETSLRLLHPVMPFITEQIWQSIPHEGESIMVAPFPTVDAGLIDEGAERSMELVKEAVTVIRNQRAEAGVPPGKSVRVYASPATAEARQTFPQVIGTVANLAKVSELHLDGLLRTPRVHSAITHTPSGDYQTILDGVVDVDKEIARVTNELAEVERELARSQAKLSNEQFLSRAPAHVVEKEQRIAQELTEKRSKLQQRLEMLDSRNN